MVTRDDADDDPLDQRPVAWIGNPNGGPPGHRARNNWDRYCPITCGCVCHQPILAGENAWYESIGGTVLDSAADPSRPDLLAYRVWAIDGPRYHGEASVVVFVESQVPEGQGFHLPNRGGVILNVTTLRRLLALAHGRAPGDWSDPPHTQVRAPNPPQQPGP